MIMKKICFVSDKNPNDKRAWSGIFYSINEQLKKHYSVEYIIVNKSKLMLFTEKIMKVFFRMFGKKYIPFLSLKTAKILYKKYNNIVFEKDVDAFFVIGSQTSYILKDSNKPIYYFSDALIDQMIDYYYYNVPNFNKKDGFYLQKYILDKAYKSIFTSKWACDCAANNYEVDPCNVVLIHFGANIRNELCNFDSREKKFDKIHLLLIGVEWERKGVPFAIKVLNELNKATKIYDLTVVGCLPKNGETYDNVEFVGFLNKNKEADFEKFSNIIKRSHIFILPTIAECAGIVFCEASAYGLPSISFDTGGVSDYVVDDLNGFVLPVTSSPADFASVIRNKILPKYHTYSKNARNFFVDKLNWDSFGKKLKDTIGD